MSRVQIPVEGMRCDGCERTVSSALERLDGVRRADADHQAKQVKVSFDSEQVEEERLRAQIEEAGYQPR